MSAPVLTLPAERGKGLTDRFLSIFADVRGGEGIGALLLAANVFLLLAAYYILKTVREALILSEGGAETKIYSSAVQAGCVFLTNSSCRMQWGHWNEGRVSHPQ